MDDFNRAMGIASEKDGTTVDGVNDILKKSAVSTVFALFAAIDALFAIVCVILLVRLLMAMMTNTFRGVQEKAQLECARPPQALVIESPP